MTEKQKLKEEAKVVKAEEKLIVEQVKGAAKQIKEIEEATTTEIKDVKEEKVLEESEDKEEKKKPERAAIAYVYSSSNNTIVHITDLAGNTLSRVTGGMITKHSRLKSNPTTAMFVAKKASERPRDLGISELYIRMRGKTGATGYGPGAHAAVKTLGKEGFRIINILDITRVARGGPKQKGGRRGRRV